MPKPWLAPSSIPLGNGMTTNYTYDFRMRLTGIQTGPGGSPTSAQNLTMTYDLASNIACVGDNNDCASGTTGEKATYGYDDLDRLTSMQINGSTAATYTYNAIGNMTLKVESYAGMLSPTNLTQLNYPSTGQAHPHAVTSTAGTPALSLGYDANGNLLTQGSSAYAFDVEIRLKARSVSGGSLIYQYDAGGTMVKRTNADGSYTVYVGGVFERSFTSAGVITGTTKYYGVAGRTIAVRQNGALSYLLADHLGSTVGTVDAVTGAVSTQKYWPYGATRSGSITQTDKQYTGQQVEPGDSALGLYNYKARFYSTVIGRFVSADEYAQGVDESGLNRYSYVLGNPLRYVAPSGLCLFNWSCSASDVRIWIGCALNGCDTPNLPAGISHDQVITMTQLALQSSEFWGNADAATSGTTLREDVTVLILTSAVQRHSDPFKMISDEGWNVMGSWWIGVDAGRRPLFSGYYKAALQTFVSGGNALIDLGDGIIGTWQFWGHGSVFSFAFRSVLNESGVPDENVEWAENRWTVGTLLAAYRHFPRAGGEPWSVYQQEILVPLHVGVKYSNSPICEAWGCGAPQNPTGQ